MGDGANADGRGLKGCCYRHAGIVAPAEASLQNGEAVDAAGMYEEADNRSCWKSCMAIAIRCCFKKSAELLRSQRVF